MKPTCLGDYKDTVSVWRGGGAVMERTMRCTWEHQGSLCAMQTSLLPKCTDTNFPSLVQTIQIAREKGIDC